MAVTQISVFVESRPGHLHRVLERLAACDVSIRGFSAGDTGEYGIVRFIVDKPDEAIDNLAAEGLAVRATPVLCLRLDDEPGELMRLLRLLAERSINVVYCYSLSGSCIALAVDDIDAAGAALAESSFGVLDQADIASLEPLEPFQASR